jgi:hypothetical protein
MVYANKLHVCENLLQISECMCSNCEALQLLQKWFRQRKGVSEIDTTKDL